MITKPLFVLLVSLLFVSTGFTQLDSISVSTNFTSIPDPYDSTSTIELLNIDIWFNDGQDVGAFELFVLDSATNSPIGYKQADSLEIYSTNMIDSLGHMIIVVEEISSNISSVVKIIVRNSQMFFVKEEIIEL